MLVKGGEALSGKLELAIRGLIAGCDAVCEEES